MGREWNCICKDCGTGFSYSDTKYQAGRVRGHSRPERCDNCRAQHAREIQSVGQAYYKVKALRPIGDPRRLTSDLGRFDRADRPHEAVDTRPAPIDTNKFGIKDDRIVEMFDFFKQDPGLQVVVVVGPTGSGKSTYFPYRLVEPPSSYLGPDGDIRDTYWTVPIETDADLVAAREAVKHTPLVKGHHRHFTSPPSDARAVAHKVSGRGGLDPRMFWRYGQIVVTQPRIQATRNIPDFIAKAMMGCKLGAGHDVGFRHSGAPNSDWSSKLAFVTDGTLITWIAKGDLDKINTIMIDEAHERSLNIDIIIGMLTQLLPRYPRLRLIIASATISADKFIDHFNRHLPRRTDKAGNVLPNCRLMEFEGKSFKVSPHFRRPDEPPLDYHRETLTPGADGNPRWEGRNRQPGDLHKHVAEMAVEILKAMYDTTQEGGYLLDGGQRIDITERQGDVLAFLHGEVPIQNCCQLVEKLGRDALGDRFKLRALPLYTTLKMSEQEEALREREQPHGVLFAKLVSHLTEVASGQKPAEDVLAILNNAGQIHNLCADLEKRVAAPTIRVKRGKEEVDEPNPLAPLNGKVVFVPWFTPETARQLFETMPERADLKVPQKQPGVVRVIISTTRHRAKLAESFATVIELPPEERRVVVSTNVAETSLTIHGILHVVDSGLINQNKWDPVTQTSGVSPILQSRAGCKQRWGRAGRLQAGDAWLLYTQAQFGKEQGEDDNNQDRVFVFYSLPEIMRSPLEQVLLTAKKAGVESLDPSRFPWLDAPDDGELRRSVRSLTQKGALDDDGDLTSHGVELSGMVGVEARVGNMLVAADRFACAIEMASAVAVAGVSLKKLLEFDKRWDEASIQEVRRRQAEVFAGCRDDLDAALKIVACWEEMSFAGEAFANVVRLIADGDALDSEYRAAPGGPAGDRVRRLIEDIRKADTEEEMDRLSDDLAKTNRNRARQRELRVAAAASHATRCAYRRLGGAWRAAVNAWSFPKIWDEAVAAPIAAARILRENAPSAEREAAAAELIEYFPLLREAVARGGKAPNECRKELARKLGRGVSTYSQLLDFLAGIGVPHFAEEPLNVADGLASLPPDSRRAANDALARLPEATARAWARTNYLVPDTLAAVMAARSELLEPLEAHKKGTERRPLDLTRNDRLRALFAKNLPDNAFKRGPDGRYRPVVQTGDTTAPLDVEPAADSVCAASTPDLFVCVERRAGPNVEGKDRKLFASFLVALPSDWAAVMSDSVNPLHSWSAVRLGRFVAERCKCDLLMGRDLLADTIYPNGSLCTVRVVRQLDGRRWEVTANPPHRWPEAVVLRAKRSSDEEKLEPEAEDAIRATNKGSDERFGFTNNLRQLKAGEAVEESKGQIDPRQWEALFHVSHDSISDAPAVGAAVVVVADRVPRPIATVGDATAVVTTDRPLQPGQEIVAEVVALELSDSGGRVPRLRYPTGIEQFQRLVKAIQPTDIGRDYSLVVARVERLPLDAGTVLVAREPNSGAEVTFGPRDLSFINCGAIPELVARHLPPGSSLQARLVQIDPDSGRLRMTTHHVFDSLFGDTTEVTGKQTVEVLLQTPKGPFVRVLRKDSAKVPTERMGLAIVGKLAEGQLLGEPVGSRHEIHLTLPNRTRESWPKGEPVPSDLKGDDPAPESVIASVRVPAAVVARWLIEVGDRRAPRAAVYSLYERTHQLSGMDEAEYARWSSCIGRRVKGRVTRSIPGAGLSLELAGLPGVPVWLPRDEFTWYCDEEHTDAAVGTELEVTGLEVNLERWQLEVSRRRLMDNPYLNYAPGQIVDCGIVRRNQHGAELSVNRLRGWIFNEHLIRLPWEDFGNCAQEQFDAMIDEVNAEAGKLTLSRHRLFQTRLRERANGVVLEARLLELSRKDRQINGALVQLMEPDLVAFLPVSEVTWLQGNAEGDRFLQQLERRAQGGERVNCEVVLLPLGERDRGDAIRVSRKRAWSGEFVLSGSTGLFFGKKWVNVRTAIAACAACGPVGVDEIKGIPGRLLVGADTRAGFTAIVSQLTSLANQNRCGLVIAGVPRSGPISLADVRPSGQTQRKSISTSGASLPSRTQPPVPVAPAPPVHAGSPALPLLAKVGQFLRGLLRG